IVEQKRNNWIHFIPLVGIASQVKTQLKVVDLSFMLYAFPPLPQHRQTPAKTLPFTKHIQHLYTVHINTFLHRFTFESAVPGFLIFAAVFVLNKITITGKGKLQSYDLH